MWHTFHKELKKHSKSGDQWPLITHVKLGIQCSKWKATKKELGVGFPCLGHTKGNGQ